MVSAERSPASLERLADQLSTLSELTETLTYRLLELEERLGQKEAQILALLEGAAGADPSHALEERLAETDDRISRIEAVLEGEASGHPAPGRNQPRVLSPAARLMAPIEAPARHRKGASVEAYGGEEEFDPIESEEDPFIVEGEQPFMDDMDELIA
jgi:hypothetical protein